MSEEKFDAIVVGAGVAGCVAAYVLAKEGLDVLVIERGNYAGSKNMTGGRLYAHSLERVMPGFAEEAPVERLVTREKISFITDDDSVTLDYHTGEAFSAEAASYTVLRGKFDQWLQEKAESEGAQFIPGIRVDRLLQDETGRVTGVQAGEDELLAECVILADGVNSLLAQSIGLLPKYHAHQYAVGAKEVIGLSKQVINDRFGLSDGEGAAWLFAGSASAGLMGGGFLYTNEDSISLGVVCGLGDIEKSPKTVPQMLEDLKNHPSVKPLIEGGELLEYSGHLVPEGGYDMVPEKLAADGVLITGDAAALCINLGFIVRGGENISSREVEDIVLEYPGVREAAVVAMPDERLGERSCACVSMRPGAPAMHLTDLVAFFDGRRVAKYKFPEYLVVLDALPRTSSGKLQKFALARMVRERVAAGQPSD